MKTKKRRGVRSAVRMGACSKSPGGLVARIGLIGNSRKEMGGGVTLEGSGLKVYFERLQRRIA